MFEVLAFVYQNYFLDQTQSEIGFLEKKLSSVGFESEEIDDALTWLKDLNLAAKSHSPQPWLFGPSPLSVRIFPPHEQNHLGTAALGFILYLEQSGALPSQTRELVIDRAMAAPGGPIKLEDLKIIILMVFWGFGKVPDPLLFDELNWNDLARTVH